MAMKKFPEPPELWEHVPKLLVLMRKVPDLLGGALNVENNSGKMYNFPESLEQMAHGPLLPWKTGKNSDLLGEMIFLETLGHMVKF